MKKEAAILLVIAAAVMWAVSGVAAQDFFRRSDRSAMDLTNIRMILAGCLLLPAAWRRGGIKRSVAALRKNPHLTLNVLIYSLIGIFLVQYTYFQGISAGGAAATTVICNTCPAMVICYDALRYRQFPRIGETLAVIFAVCGIFLLVTGGNPEKLSVPLSCLLWSLASAASFAFSMIYPRKLLRETDTFFLMSAGMLIGGAVSCLFVDTLNWGAFFTRDVRWNLAYIVVFGTAAAFLMFNAGLVWLTSEEAAVTATVEPAASAAISAAVFGAQFGGVELAGMAMVLSAILVPHIGKIRIEAICGADLQVTDKNKFNHTT